MAGKGCCDCVGCTDCFSTDADDACCRLSPSDKLVLKIPRPGWALGEAIEIPDPGTGSPCPCPSGSPTRLTASLNYAAAFDILVNYEHFRMASDSGGYSWFAENGSFGCVGGTGERFSPSNSGRETLWKLFPNPCPQEFNNQPYCCNTSCNCGSQAGPSTDFPLQNGVCSTSDPRLTLHQEAMIAGNQANRSVVNGNCSNTPGAPARIANNICYYDGFDWIDGISGDSYNTNPFFGYHHYYWDGSGVVQKLDAGGNAALLPLAYTIVSVYHREKWYQACEKADQPTSSCENVLTWGCRVPEYWIFACAGLPVFSWEIHEMFVAGKITSDEYNHFFESQYLNEPLGGGTFGPSLVKKLETSHWHAPSDAAGYSILQTKDWRGVTFPGETTPVPSTETRLVRKDLKVYSSTGATQIQDNQLYDARRGGWTHCCRNPPKACGTGNCSQASYNGADIEAKGPQIPHEIGCKDSGLGDCEFETYSQPGQEALTTGQRCFTAAPFPQCVTCTDGVACGNCRICNGLAGCTDCGAPISQQCGGDIPSLCAQDRYAAYCDSIHFTFVVTTNNQTGNLNNEPCAITHHAYLFALNENCKASQSAPFECLDGDCPEGPVTETGRRSNYSVSPLISKRLDCNEITNGNLCEGAEKINFEINTGYVCPAGLAKQVNMPDPSNQIGSSMKQPKTDRGCGKYLCNEKTTNPIGACCDDNGDCIDAITESQCQACNGIWHGRDSCCGINDDLC